MQILLHNIVLLLQLERLMWWKGNSGSETSVVYSALTKHQGERVMIVGVGDRPFLSCKHG